MIPLNVPKPKPSPYAQMRDAIQARCIKRGTDWEYLSEDDRRALSATALEAGDDCWLDYTNDLMLYIAGSLAAKNDSESRVADRALVRAAIQIAHHSGKYLYEDTWPRMDAEEFTDDSNVGKRLNEGDL